MPAEYAAGYRKPPVNGRFQKGQSGNPGGRPRPRPGPTRRQRFAQILEAGLQESTETVATTECGTTLAAWAKGLVLDGVRGKTASIRLTFTFLDELDAMEGNLVRTRRAKPERMREEREAAEEGNEADSLRAGNSQGLSEEQESPPMWCEFAGEPPQSTIKTESPPATKEEGARPLTEGKEQGAKTESERRFLAISRKTPSEKELRRREEQAEMDRQRQIYESLPGKLKAFAEKHGFEYPGTASGEPRENAPAPLSEGKSQAIINSRPEEGPHKRELRRRLENLAAAERVEAARKAALAAKAEGSLMLRPAAPRTQRGEQAQHEGLSAYPRPEPVVGRNIDTQDSSPLPDFTIWLRGQPAAP